MTQSDPEKHRRRLEALGRISPAVAHDINNLLSGILGYSQMAQGDPGKEELGLCLEEIEKSGRRIASLARILQILRPRSDGLPETFDLDALIGDLEKYLRLVVEPENGFSFTPGSGLPPVHADRSLLSRALFFLAVDAAGSGPKAGVFALETRRGNGGEVLLLATLPGIPDPGAHLSEDIGEIVQRCGGRLTTGHVPALHLYLPAATR
jgi:nitrogen-specific signal transduction histidine kinase